MHEPRDANNPNKVHAKSSTSSYISSSSVQSLSTLLIQSRPTTLTWTEKKVVVLNPERDTINSPWKVGIGATSPVTPGL